MLSTRLHTGWLMGPGPSLAYRKVSRILRVPRRFVAGAGRLRPAASDTPSGARFLREVRSRCYARYSDAGLRDAFGLLSIPAGRSEEEVLADGFAIVDEAVARRLGAWRLFDESYSHPLLEPYRDAARRLIQLAPYKSNVGYYTDDAFLDSPDFRRSLVPVLDEMDLDDARRTIVAAMVYVAEKGAFIYPSEILLPEDFYSALSATPMGDALAFRATDEQLSAGRLLYSGNVVEMNAGEGKTVSAVFPAVLHAALRRTVHVITANDYLAARDTQWMGPVYESLGLGVRSILGHMTDPERKDAYESASVLYGTLREFGFDFLRDNLRHAEQELVQGRLDVAVVDEADQVLIDESLTPLIIAGPPSAGKRSVYRAKRAVQELIAHQGEIVGELEASARRAVTGSRVGGRLLAKLLLAEPDSPYLVFKLAQDQRLKRRVRELAETGRRGDTEGAISLGLHYTLDPQRSMVTMTERGQELVEAMIGPVFDTGELERELAALESREGMSLARRRLEAERLQRNISRRHSQMNQVHQMLRAYLLLARDEDYIVAGGRVVLVDKLTGRRRPDNRYQHGLQSALEAKEGVRVHADSDVLAQISVQGFMSQYNAVAGITGTAMDARDEFRRFYGHDVVSVPPTRPLRRVDLPVRLHESRREKLSAVVREVQDFHRVGRPVLVATLTVEQSEEVSKLLGRRGVVHRVLNAVTSAEEAQVVRSAGEFGAVTVATNMAGRGTDIVLEPGLNGRVTRQYVLLTQRLLSDGAGRVVLSCASVQEAGLLQTAVSAAGNMAVAGAERAGMESVVVTFDQEAIASGETVELEFGLGLHVIGTEMNDSARIDRQLRGRGGRQGDFGTSRFVLSLEDTPLLQWPGPSPGVRRGAGRPHKVFGYLEGPAAHRRVRAAQAAVEMEDEALRGSSLDFGKVIERQALAYYGMRRQVMASASFHSTCMDMVGRAARRIVRRYISPATVHRYYAQFEKMTEELRLDYGVDAGPLLGLGVDALETDVDNLLRSRLQELSEASREPDLQMTEKLLYLQAGDDLWVAFHARLQDLMLGIQVCSTGQRSATAEFMLRCDVESARFWDSVAGEFLPRLFAHAAKAHDSPAVSPSGLAADVAEILV